MICVEPESTAHPVLAAEKRLGWGNCASGRLQGMAGQSPCMDGFLSS